MASKSHCSSKKIVRQTLEGGGKKFIKWLINVWGYKLRFSVIEFNLEGPLTQK